MRTVHEVSRLTGVSIRTLQYYDRIGLLHPAGHTESGYRLYDDTALEKLQQILLFRELQFPLKDIKGIMESPDFDRERALEQQITLLTLKKEHLENLIDLARGIKAIGVNIMENPDFDREKALEQQIELLSLKKERLENLIDLARKIKKTGVNTMDFTAFDTKKIDEYAAQAKASWGNTAEYREFEEKSKGRTPEEEKTLSVQMMAIFAEFGRLREGAPDSEEAQALVKQLQDFITEHFYTCSDEILSGLGKMYAGGGDFTKNIDAAGGAGTAAFVNEAIMSSR